MERKKLGREPIERFWRGVRLGEGCWLWDGAIAGTTGYGTIWDGKKTRGVHVFAWTEVYGHTLEPGQQVLHKCDVPSCVREDHLFAGTQRENLEDCRRKGRARRALGRGERHNKAKLNRLKVRVARRLYAVGYSYAWLGRYYGVGRSAMKAAVDGKTWKTA